MLDDSMKTQLQAFMEKLLFPVVLSANLGEDDGSSKMRTLLGDIAALSPLLSFVESHDASLRTPSFGIAREGSSMRLRFAGLPMGHEFSSLVLALLQAGGHPPRVDAATIERIRSLKGPLHFETFVSLSCQNCPDVVQALNLMAVLNPAVSHEMVEGGMFQDEVAERRILSVPTVLLNGETFDQGRMDLEQILARLDAEGAQQAAARLGEREPYDMLIVGGGPAGAAAAVYAARKGIRTGMVTERFGGQVLDTLGIENFISVSHTEGPQMVAQMEAQVRGYGVDLITNQRAVALQPAAADDALASLQLDSGATLRARSVVLATGARWRQLNVPGEAQYRNRGVAYCPHCDGPLFKGKRVAVIGGGNSGVEAAIDLAGITEHVTLVEFDERLRADEVLQRKLRSLPNVDVVTSAQSTQVQGNDEHVTGLEYIDRRSGESRQLAVKGIFVQIGLLPNTEWLKGGPLRLSARGEIEIDAHGATSVPGVFAAGDATTVPFKQIVIAMGEGSRAALSAFDHLIRTTAPAAAQA